MSTTSFSSQVKLSGNFITVTTVDYDFSHLEAPVRMQVFSIPSVQITFDLPSKEVPTVNKSLIQKRIEATKRAQEYWKEHGNPVDALIKVFEELGNIDTDSLSTQESE